MHQGFADVVGLGTEDVSGPISYGGFGAAAAPGSFVQRLADCPAARVYMHRRALTLLADIACQASSAQICLYFFRPIGRIHPYAQLRILSVSAGEPLPDCHAQWQKLLGRALRSNVPRGANVVAPHQLLPCFFV